MIKDIVFFEKKKFSNIKKKFKLEFFCEPVVLIPLVLVLVSSLLIHSVQRQSFQSDSLSHLTTGIVGYFLALLISYIPLSRIKNYILPVYLLTIISLILVYFFGISMYGAQRWLSLGLVTFQPSEVAKLATILALASVLDRKDIHSIRNLIIPFLVVLIPWVLIFFQPDLGTSLVLIFLFFTMIYWVQTPIEWILIIVFSAITAWLSFLMPNLLFLWIPFIGFLAYKSFRKKTICSLFSMLLHIIVSQITPILWEIGLKDYQKDRLILFLDPSRDPLGGGYHLLQSKIAVGSGGLIGTGFLNGKLTNLQFIPEQHTDFIFSALGEEVGFIGSFITVFLFFALITQLITISKNARSDFESLVVIGVASILLFQIIVNIFMTIGLGPVTGIPLPFMSYGRTALLINFVCIGMVLSTLKRCRSLRKK